MASWRMKAPKRGTSILEHGRGRLEEPRIETSWAALMRSEEERQRRQFVGIKAVMFRESTLLMPNHRIITLRQCILLL
jgi:hypothetical protein